MWLTRAEYDALVRENARLASSCDWLSQLVTTLQQERAVLLERVLEVQIPVMSIAREERETRRAPDVLTPEMLSKLTASYIPPMDAPPGRVYRPTDPEQPAEAEAAAAMAIFEDAGDERASKMGAEWGVDGELVHTR